MAARLKSKSRGTESVTTRSRPVRHSAVGWLVTIAAAQLLALSSASAEAQSCPGELFEARLDPVAFQPLTKANVGGDGRIAARLSDGEFTLEGLFEGLPAPATHAALYRGSGIGVPGDAIFELNPGSATTGRIEGKFGLEATLISALRQGHIYIRIDTAAAPDGAAWAWFLPLSTTGECRRPGQ